MEIESREQPVSDPTRLLLHIPRVLRNPVLAGRMLLATVIGTAGTPIALDALNAALNPRARTAEAADPLCMIGKIAVFGSRYVDHPTIPNRQGLSDPTDFSLGISEFGAVIVNTLEDPENPNSKRTEVARANLIPADGDHEEVVIKDLPVKPNTKGQNGKDAAQLKFSFQNDPIRQFNKPDLPVEVSVTIECGKNGTVWGGKYAAESGIEAARDTSDIYSVGEKIDTFRKKVFGSIAVSLTPKGDNPQQNAKIFKNNIEAIKKHAIEVRAKEKADAEKTNPAITPAPTRTTLPSSAPTPPAKPGGTSAPSAASPDQTARVQKLEEDLRKLQADNTAKSDRINKDEEIRAEQAAKITEADEKLKTAQQASQSQLKKLQDDADKTKNQLPIGSTGAGAAGGITLAVAIGALLKKFKII